MDRVTQLENAIKFASQNPTDPKSLQLKTAIQAGKYNTELEQLKTKNQAPVVPVDTTKPEGERNIVQKTLGAFLDPIIETGVHAGEAIGSLALKGANALSGGALDKYSKTGNLDESLANAVNQDLTVPVLGTKVTKAKDITPENTAGRALSSVALGVGSPASAGALLAGGEAMQQDKGAGEVVLDTVVGAIGGKILEHGFNAVAPYVEKAVAKYGTPIIEKLQQFIPDSAKGFMDNLASKLPNIAEKKLPESVSGAINKGQEVLNNVIDKPLEKGFQKAKQGVEFVKEKGFKPQMTSDEATGQIIQGKPEDIPAGKRVLSDVYPDGIPSQVKTTDILSEVDSKIKPLAKQVDEAYNNLPDNLPKRLQELYLPETTSSGKIVNTNYVQEALSNMKELYQKTGDNVAFVEIKDLITKAKKQGLTYKEVNDIAKKYNIEFGDKAFAKVSGDPLTSVNAQKYEHIRKGLKNTARQGLGGEEAKFLDSKLSDYYDTRQLLKKQLDRVNAEAQKTKKTGLIQQAVKKIISTADTLSGGVLKAIGKEIGLGNTTMSQLEIEKGIKRSLEIIKKNKNLSEAEIENRLMKIFDDANVVPPANRPKAVNIPDAPEGTLVNIGMKIGKTDKMISKTEIQTILKKYGVKVEKSKIADSGTEPTFIAKLSKSLTDEEMYNLSKDLQQEAIPQLVNGVGKNHGAKNMDWGDFNPEYFMDLTGKTLK